MSNAEREFFGGDFAQDVRTVNEFLREEYDDWDSDDDLDDLDDYFDYTQDNEPWESVPWDWEFDDYDAPEETPYGRRSSSSWGAKGPTENYSYTAPGEDPWNSPGGWTYSAAGDGYGYAGAYSSGTARSSTWSKTPSVTPEEAMTKAIREGWKAEGLSRIQACMLLGLSGQPSAVEVSKVRRQMALRWHPDKNPDNANANTAFQLVMAAAVKLSV